MAIVSIASNKDPGKMVYEAIELLGGVGKFIGLNDKVLIKPNIRGGVPGKSGTFASPEVADALIEIVKRKTGEIVIGEADSCMYDADKMFSETGIKDVAEKHGIELANLSEEEMEELTVEDGFMMKQIKISKTVAESDKIICVPVAKTHCNTDVSLGMKCMFGILPEKKKSKYHPKLDHVIADVVKAFPPNLTLIDATTSLEGQGPFNGDPIELDMITAGDNVVATDAITSTTMGFEPNKIDHLRPTKDKGIGPIEPERITIKGKKIEEVSRNLKKPMKIKIERKLSKLSSTLGYFAIHQYYTQAVRKWKKRTR